MVARILDPDLVVPWGESTDPSFWADLLEFADCDSGYGITESTRRELVSRLDDLGLLASHVNPSYTSMIDAAIRWAPVLKANDSLPIDRINEIGEFVEANYLAGTDELKILTCTEAIGGVDHGVVEIATRPRNWGFGDGLPGKTIDTSLSGKTKTLLLNSRPDRSETIRGQAQRVETLASIPNVRQLEQQAKDLFPRLIFSTKFWNSANHFKRQIGSHREGFVHALGLLNDEGLKLFANPGGDRGVVAAFKKRGLDVSSETGATKKGRDFRQEREADFAGVGTKVCYWHLKFRNPTLRVYFEHTPDAILMGAVDEHFRTSGGSPA